MDGRGKVEIYVYMNTMCSRGGGRWMSFRLMSTGEGLVGRLRRWGGGGCPEGMSETVVWCVG